MRAEEREMKIRLSVVLLVVLSMAADAETFSWSWVVAAVDEKAEVTFLDPARAKVGRQARLHESAAIPNLLAWLT